MFARSSDAGGAKGISCFIVEAGTPGFEVTERIDLVAPHPLGIGGRPNTMWAGVDVHNASGPGC